MGSNKICLDDCKWAAGRLVAKGGRIYLFKLDNPATE